MTIDSNGWIREATGIYYPALTFGPFPAGQPKWIVIHGTAWNGGTARIIAESWRNDSINGTGKASVHALIDKSGEIVQGLPFTHTAWGNCCLSGNHANFLPSGNQNWNTLSIEHCKYDTWNTEVLTPMQQISSFALVKALCEKYGIPKQVIGIGDPSNGGIIGHKDIDVVNRSNCPGAYPWQALQDFIVAKESTPLVDACIIAIWASQASYFKGIQQSLPARDTGIFDSWRRALLRGSFKGVPISQEYACPTADGTGTTVAQNFAGGTCLWNNGNPTWV